MSLIKCTECGKEFSDKATACPNCGCPTSEMVPSAEAAPEEYINSDTDIQIKESAVNKVWGAVQNSMQTIAENNKNSIKSTRQVGPVQIDEPHKMFRINGAVPVNGKKDGIGKSMFKGMMAVGTMGMSVAAEKLVGGGNKQKVGNKEWLEFNDLINYD